MGSIILDFLRRQTFGMLLFGKAVRSSYFRSDLQELIKLLILSVPSKDPQCAGSIQYLACSYHTSPRALSLNTSMRFCMSRTVHPCLSLRPKCLKRLQECPPESLPCQPGAGMPHTPRSCVSSHHAPHHAKAQLLTDHLWIDT